MSISKVSLFGLFFTIIYILVTFISLDTSIYYLLFELMVIGLVFFNSVRLNNFSKVYPLDLWLFTIVFIFIAFSSVLLDFNDLRYNVHYILYYVFFIILFAFIYKSSLSVEGFLSFLNASFIFYFLVCLMFWVLNIELSGYQLSQKHNLKAFGIDRSVLLGLDGSPASLDSFSCLIFIVNFLFNTSKQRKLMLIISFASMLMTLRLTPLVALLLTVLVFIFVRGRLSWAVIFLSLLAGFGVVYYFSYFIYVDGVEKNFFYYTALYKATHARSVIWGQQIAVMLNNYDLFDYVVGGFNNKDFEVPLFQIDGSVISRSTYNSHSSFLLLFFRAPLIFVLFVVWLFFISLRNFNRKSACVIFYMFLCFTMNSGLLASGNLIFSFVLIYLLLPNIEYRYSNSLRKSRGF